MKPLKNYWARRIRTFEMTESESVALPLGYSPLFCVFPNPLQNKIILEALS